MPAGAVGVSMAPRAVVMVIGPLSISVSVCGGPLAVGVAEVVEDGGLGS